MKIGTSVKPGERVYHKSGRMATVVRFKGRHSGWYVRFDERRQFEPEEVAVYANSFTPTDPARHAEFEASWPVFERKHRAWAEDYPKEQS
jgi:hypothetical protein